MSLSAIRLLVESQIENWRSLRLADFQYWHRSDARLVLIGFVAIALVMLIARSALIRRPGRHRVLVPAVLTLTRRPYLSFLRHVPLVLFIVGLPFFAIALADPFTALVASDVTYPGRRIAVLIDASTSMRTPFRAATLNKRAETDAAFFTSVAAAERFIQMRKDGRYKDLLALVEFGNQAYVITPFTHDYDNILVSISLIGDPVEFSLFPDQGTIIAAAIDEGTNLFRAFNFLEASGNIMVIFSDGEDTRASIGGKSLDEIVAAARETKIPVYLVRTNYDRGRGKLIPDELWIPVIERTGGKFYAADNEKNLLAAIADIDRAAAGTIRSRQYSSQEPRFAFFAFAALVCWTGAAALKLTVPVCQKLP